MKSTAWLPYASIALSAGMKVGGSYFAQRAESSQAHNAWKKSSSIASYVTGLSSAGYLAHHKDVFGAIITALSPVAIHALPADLFCSRQRRFNQAIGNTFGEHGLRLANLEAASLNLPGKRGSQEAQYRKWTNYLKYNASKVSAHEKVDEFNLKVQIAGVERIIPCANKAEQDQLISSLTH